MTTQKIISACIVALCALTSLQCMNQTYADYSASEKEIELCKAAHDGNGTKVQALLNVKAHINCRMLVHRNRYTPLLFASNNGHESVVRLLLHQKADSGLTNKGFNYKDYEFFGHVCREHYDKARQCIAQGAQVRILNSETLEFPDEYHYTLLEAACLSNNVNRAEQLLKLGACPNQCPSISPLFYAVKDNHASLCILLVLHNASMHDNRHGRTPLRLAVDNKQWSLVRLMLDKDISQMYTKENESAVPEAELQHRLSNPKQEAWLCQAASAGNNDTAKELLASKTRVDCTMGYVQLTPLMLAAGEGHADTVKLLLDHKADPRLKTTHGFTYIDYALLGQAFKKNYSNARRYLARGAQARILDCIVFKYKEKEEFLLLEHACLEGRTEDAQNLLKLGACPNEYHDEVPPLLYAAQKGNAPLCQALIDHKAYINDAWRRVTALMLAAEQNRSDVVRLLLKHRADATMVASNGKTAFQAATGKEVIGVFKEFGLH